MRFPGTVVMTGGMRSSCSGRVAGVATTKEKRADKTNWQRSEKDHCVEKPGARVLLDGERGGFLASQNRRDVFPANTGPKLPPPRTQPRFPPNKNRTPRTQEMCLAQQRSQGQPQALLITDLCSPSDCWNVYMTIFFLSRSWPLHPSSSPGTTSSISTGYELGTTPTRT
jgi:hypothetical protein